MGSRGKRRKRRLITAALAAGVFAFVAWAAISSNMPCQVITGHNVLNIDVSSLAPGSARLLCYKDSSGEELRFLLARGQDGRVRTVFDACRQCYMYHRGFRISGNKLVCEECGTSYSIDHMNKGKASCRPIPLKHKMDGKDVEISVASLEKGHRLF